MGIKFGKLAELNVQIGDIVRVVGSVSEGRIEDGKEWVISGVTKNRYYGRSRSGPGNVDIPLSNALIWQIVSKSKRAAIDITTMEDPETVTIDSEKRTTLNEAATELVLAALIVSYIGKPVAQAVLDLIAALTEVTE
ncbi:hypothetical protein QO034_13270 [Sedimentitalea sp. JM2-8]|uniref:Uncharacterized protein n=2 Tax=Sedimentitalea xiamensis TaxID=3050037 RepID=A0ABT7FG15_9RHOB|nr:hypothetical protein [Sedimentitalea xiamensis]